MRRYGFNKATEISRKQINVIYCKAKSGELKVEKWLMSDFYFVADYYGHDDNKAVEESEQHIKGILEKVFEGDLEEAQRRIDWLTEKDFCRYSAKQQAKMDRNLIG